jgi:hypothetical protein
MRRVLKNCWMAVPTTRNLDRYGRHRLLEKEFRADKTGTRMEPIPEAVLVNGETECAVEKIVDHRMIRNRMEYLVSWKGYSHDDST